MIMEMETQLEFVDGVITDANGNTASVNYFRSEDAARRALASLIACRYCSDCIGCNDCSDCVLCINCSGCSSCIDCSDCSDCSRCSRCSDCIDMAPQPIAAPEIPSIPNIHQAIYEAIQTGGLEMSTWHTCGTTHCRAGWAVHLAGEAGYALEKRTSTEFAAMQIYRASGYPISPIRFYDSNEVAMADIKRLAGVE